MTFPFWRLSCARRCSLHSAQLCFRWFLSARVKGRSLRQLGTGARLFGFTGVTGVAYCSSRSLSSNVSCCARLAGGGTAVSLLRRASNSTGEIPSCPRRGHNLSFRKGSRGSSGLPSPHKSVQRWRRIFTLCSKLRARLHSDLAKSL